MRLMALASSSTSSRKSVANSVCATTLRVRCIMSMAMSRCSPWRQRSRMRTASLNHRACVFRDALAMKGRLRHLALRAMLRAFAGDHALAQQHLGALHRALLDEVVVLHDEHFADVVGMIQKDDVIPSDLVVSDVAIFARRGAETGGSDWPGETGGTQTRAGCAGSRAGSGRPPPCGRRSLGFVAAGCRCHSSSVLAWAGCVGAKDDALTAEDKTRAEFVAPMRRDKLH